MAQGLGGQSPARITSHLKGAQFPATKNDLVDLARSNGAEEDVLEVFENLPGSEYASAAEVMKAYGDEADRRHGPSGRQSPRH